jgi:hypothetical protein
MSPTLKKILGWIAVGLVALLAFASGAGKIFASPENEMGQKFIAAGIYDLRFLFAFLEIGSALLLVIPRTSTIGVVLTAGYFGGALAIELTHGEPPIPALVALTLVGLSALLRNPEFFTRIQGKQV